jgi:hypothetical protein
MNGLLVKRLFSSEMAFKALSISITTKTEKKAAIEARVEAAAEAAWVKKETEDKEVRTKFNGKDL